MQIKKTTINIIKGDMTALKVDAIVNPANTQMIHGGGLAKVIADKGGKNLVDESKKQAPIKLGGSIVTIGGNLPAKNVIHSATVVLGQSANEVSVRAAAASALKLANDMNFTSLAIPALGCGAGGFPLVGSAKILTQEMYRLCQHSPTTLREIKICLNDQATLDVFDKTIRGYLNHLQENLGPGPYVTTDIIIEIDDGIVIIERSNPPYGYALPGGFLDYGESLEESAIREAKEETDLSLKDLRQFHTYSEMGRDPRFQTITTVFIAKGVGKPQAGDDAKGLKVVKFADLLKYDYAFDHKDVIKDYLAANHKGGAK